MADQSAGQISMTNEAKSPVVEVDIEQSWRQVLEPEFSKPYFKQLTDFVKDEYKSAQLFPPGPEIFNAFAKTPFDQVKVVILGQDPYHGLGQAHGLSFSVKPGVKLPPSLQNIYKELSHDLGEDSASDLSKIAKRDGDLTHWAEQGVLLLNSTLTVRAHTPGSHQNNGWEEFTDAAIRALAENKQNLVFILWGAYAQKKGAVIDEAKHLVLKSPHPSPFSANRGFFGSRPFSKANAYLEAHGREVIRW